jgi:hypothetical protein
LRSSRHMSSSHLLVKLKSAASYKRLFIHLRLRLSAVIKYYDTLFHYDVVSDIHLYCLSYVWNLILMHI